MKMTDLNAIYNIQPIIFSDEQRTVYIPEKCFIWDLSVLGGEIYLLYPGAQVEVFLLR